MDVDSVSAVVLFSGRELAPTSEAFKGGSLVAFFGGFQLDLRGCRLAEGAHLDVTTAFGGCEIRVPPGWRIDVRGPAIFGGVEDGARGQPLPPDAPTLSLRVLAAFGGCRGQGDPGPGRLQALTAPGGCRRPNRRARTPSYVERDPARGSRSSMGPVTAGSSRRG
jgi:hypothetical protein